MVLFEPVVVLVTEERTLASLTTPGTTTGRRGSRGHSHAWVTAAAVAVVVVVVGYGACVMGTFNPLEMDVVGTCAPHADRGSGIFSLSAPSRCSGPTPSAAKRCSRRAVGLVPVAVVLFELTVVAVGAAGNAAVTETGREVPVEPIAVRPFSAMEDKGRPLLAGDIPGLAATSAVDPVDTATPPYLPRPTVSRAPWAARAAVRAALA